MLEKLINIIDGKVLVREATKQGYAIAIGGDSINLEQPNSKTRRGRVGRQIANTLTTSCNQGVLIENDYKSNYKGIKIKKESFDMDKLKVFESFSGVGSQAMALRNIGVDFEVVGISEVDKWALLAYDAIHNNQEGVEIKTKEEMLEEIRRSNIAYNFSTGKSEIPKNENDIRRLYEAHIRSKNYGDITKINEKELPDFDLFTYSFPCKNISVAGQQAGLEEGSGTQSSLVWECRRIIREKMPKYLMMENVKNLVGKKHKPFFDLWCKTLEDLGYINYWKVLNGKNYNVPQNRERVIMISIRKDIDKEFEMPLGREDNGVRLKDILENEVDSKYYIDSEKLIFDDKILKQLPLIGASRGRYVDKDKTITKQHLEVNQKGVSNSLTTVQTDNLVVEENKLIQVGMLNERGNESNRRVYSEEGLSPTLNSMNGGNRQPKILCVGNVHPSGKGMNGQVYDSDGLSPTVTTNKGEGHKILIKNKYTHIDDTQDLDKDYRIRKLTPLECWRLMGYTDEDFYKAKDVAKLSNSKLYERAGRGIVVPMLEDIFKNLFKEYIS